MLSLKQSFFQHFPQLSRFNEQKIIKNNGIITKILFKHFFCILTNILTLSLIYHGLIHNMEPSIKKEIEISNEEILKHIKEIVKPENLDTLTARKVRGELEKSLNLPNDFLLHKKTEINNMLDDFISKIDGENSTKVYSNTHEYFDGPINSKVDPDYKSFQNKVQNDKISTKRKQESMMSIDEFLEKAKIINLEIEGSGTKIPITPRKFSTGSVGWHFGNKIPLPVGNDTEVICQISINCTVVGSKSWPEKPNKKAKN